MIDKAFDRIARVIELALAVAFILAVLLNFTNVVGRYLFGISLLGSDEVQVFIMVGMTFLGAAVVTRRNRASADGRLGPVHAGARCDSRCGSPSRSCCRRWPASCCRNPIFMPAQMFRIGRTSDMAGVPMWIPHGTVAFGFALILLIAGLAPCHRDNAARGRAFGARRTARCRQ